MIATPNGDERLYLGSDVWKRLRRRQTTFLKPRTYTKYTIVDYKNVRAKIVTIVNQTATKMVPFEKIFPLTTVTVVTTTVGLTTGLPAVGRLPPVVLRVDLQQRDVES